MPTQATRSNAFTPRTVLMRLTRGASSHVSWMLRRAASATTVTVGADPTCDWQVRAPGVPRHALSVALFDGGLFVASGPGAEVIMEGELLPEVWKRVERPLAVTFGTAQVEIAWEASEAELTMGSERERPTLPDGVGSAARGRASWVERLSRPSWIDSPSVLGRTAQSRKSAQLLRYAGLLVFAALAYRAWLLLLDRI